MEALRGAGDPREQLLGRVADHHLVGGRLRAGHQHQRHQGGHHLGQPGQLDGHEVVGQGTYQAPLRTDVVSMRALKDQVLRCSIDQVLRAL